MFLPLIGIAAFSGALAFGGSAVLKDDAPTGWECTKTVVENVLHEDCRYTYPEKTPRPAPLVHDWQDEDDRP